MTFEKDSVRIRYGGLNAVTRNSKLPKHSSPSPLQQSLTGNYMERSLNPNPPHMVVIDHIEWKSWRDSELWLECPFALEVDTSNDFLQPQLHTEMNYCTYYMQRPAVTFELHYKDLYWKSPGPFPAPKDSAKPRVERGCKIEVGQRAIGTCLYTELVWNMGLADTLCPTLYWKGRDQGHWPNWMPAAPGRYPVYYWQDGEGESFQNGLTFDNPNEGNLWDAN